MMKITVAYGALDGFEGNHQYGTPTRRLNNADLPTFGLPTIATFGRR